MREPEDLSFDGATAVQQTGDPALFEARVHHLWTVGDKPNGGYLLALLGRAARIVARGAGSPDWEVLASSITYLRPPEIGPATVRTTLLRSGRTAAHVRAVLAQGGDDLVDAVYVLGALPEVPATRYDGTEPFHAPGPEECVRLTPKIPTGVYVGIMDVLDLRLDPATLPFAVSPPPPGTPAELARLDTVRRRFGARRPFRSLLRRRHPAGNAHDRFHRLGADTADVRLRAGAPGAGLARHPHDRRPGCRRDGRRDMRSLGQPGAHGGSVHPAGPAPLPRRDPLIQGRRP